MSADDSKSGEASLYEHHEHLIEVFFDFILDNLRVTHLLLELHLEEVRRVTPRLHKLENDNDLRGAAKELMLAIKRSEEPEKWKMFFGALRQDGASLILDTLLEETEGDLWHTERRNLIDVFKKDLQEALDLERILPAALDKELIHKEDADNLKTMIKDGSHARAIGTFLIILHRRKTEWYKDFLTILHDHNYNGLAETIEPGFGKKLREQRAHTEQEEMKRVDREAAASRRGGGESRHADPRPAAEGEGGLHDSLDQVSAGRATVADNPEDSSLPQNQPVAAPARPGASGGDASTCSCGCRCCTRVMTELAAVRSDIAELKLMLLKDKDSSSGGQP